MAAWLTATRTWAAGEVLTAANMNAQVRDFANGFGAWGSYTPALTASTTNPTLGTGSSVAGAYGQVQKKVDFYAVINGGTAGTAAGTGTYNISIPVARIAGNRNVGGGSVLDSSTPAGVLVAFTYQATGVTTVTMGHGGGFVTAASFNIIANRSYAISGSYEAA